MPSFEEKVEYCPSFPCVMIRQASTAPSSTLGFAFSLLVPALFFVAAHYRDVTFRMRALCTLRRCGWEAIRLATIAEQMIELEQKGCEDAIVAADILRSNKIRAVEVKFRRSKVKHHDGRGASCKLVYLTHPYTSLSSIQSRTFEWEDVTDQALQESVSGMLGRMLNFEFLSTVS